MNADKYYELAGKKMLKSLLIAPAAKISSISGHGSCCSWISTNLEGKTCVFISCGDKTALTPVLNETRVTVNFGNETQCVGGSGGCNSYVASYHEGVQKLVLTLLHLVKLDQTSNGETLI